MQQIDLIFSIIIFIMSVVVHEVSHGYAALSLGDPTAKLAGRLTLNPIKHLDPVGSIILPLILIISHAGFVFGWAKPVPYNPYNLRNRKWGDALVAIAGPLSNICLALFFGLLIRVSVAYDIVTSPAFISIASIVVIVNLVLALFNLVPIPPLDGSKILFSFLPFHWSAIKNSLEQYGIFLLLIFIFFLWQYLLPLISIAFTLITGLQI